jgi:hypothetical protein
MVKCVIYFILNILQRVDFLGGDREKELDYDRYP